MGIFITIGIIGLGLLMLSFIFDGILDGFDIDFGGDGIFSISSVLGFLSAFGFGGWLSLSAFSDSMGVAIAVGAVLGLIIGGLTGVLMRFLRNSETGSVDHNTLVGQRGTALESAQPGELFPFSVFHHGMISKMSASVNADVTRGDQMIVSSVISSTQVQVVPVPDSLSLTTEKE